MRLHDYLKRLDVASPVAADVQSLRRLHIAHREAFLFENLAIQTGGRISVALDDIERKFIDEGRGGYCFEHNTLFAAALRDVGLPPTVLLGRVRRGPPELWRRTHMVLDVPVDGESWLADVGFGGIGLIEPMLLRDGAVSRQTGITYTVRREHGLWILAADDGRGAIDLYEFSGDAQTAGDVEVANHYTSTHPDSIFRRTITIQRSTRMERTILRSDALTRYRDGRIEERPIDVNERRTLARDLFGVELPAGPLVCDTYDVQTV
jgi:N-hydroxyarylamine O-acetyltransferase